MCPVPLNFTAESEAVFMMLTRINHVHTVDYLHKKTVSLRAQCNSYLKGRKKANSTFHSFDLQSPAGRRVPPGWHPCLAGWSPAASGASLSARRHRQADTRMHTHMFYEVFAHPCL